MLRTLKYWQYYWLLEDTFRKRILRLKKENSSTRGLFNIARYDIDDSGDGLR